MRHERDGCVGSHGMRLVVFTLVTRGRFFLTSASTFNIEPNGGIFDVSAENDRTSLNLKTAFRRRVATLFQLTLRRWSRCVQSEF